MCNFHVDPSRSLTQHGRRQRDAHRSDTATSPSTTVLARIDQSACRVRTDPAAVVRVVLATAAAATSSSATNASASRCSATWFRPNTGSVLAGHHSGSPRRKRRRDSAAGEAVATMPEAATASTEGGDETLAKLGAHEAVGDRVAAGRDERQEMDVVHGRAGDALDGAAVVEHRPGLQHVHRGPADEELDDDRRQHLNAALLRAHSARVVAAAAAGVRQRRIAVTVDAEVAGRRRRTRPADDTLVARRSTTGADSVERQHDRYAPGAQSAFRRRDLSRRGSVGAAVHRGHVTSVVVRRR